MSTGAAGAAATSGGQGGDGGTGQGVQQDAGQGGDAPSLADIAAGLAAQQTSQQEMYDYLRSQPWTQQEAQPGQQEPQQTQQPEPLDLSFLNMDDPAFDPGQMAEKLGSLIESTVEQRVQQGIQQAVSPLAEQQAQMKREAEAQALVGEFPEFGEPETAQAVLQTAAQLAEAAGHPELANEPWMWRLTYMAGRAADAAQEEQEDQPAPAHLESGSGATPGGTGGGMTAADIVGAKRGASVLPFG